MGIDPRGGLAVIRTEGAHAVPMPMTDGKEIDIEAVRDFILAHTPKLVVIEKQQGTGSTGTAMVDYGKLLGCLNTLGVRVMKAPPMLWKNRVLADTPKDKAAAISFAKARYPQVDLVPPRGRVPHTGMVYALCLAHYGVAV